MTGLAWTPIFVLPNLNVLCTIECDAAAIVNRTDERVEGVVKEHPTFGSFLSKFQDQFGEDVDPAILMLKTEARRYFTEEAVSAFRDLVALSVVPRARARRLCSDRAQPLAFSDVFDFYPWMLDKDFADLTCFTPAIRALHDLSKFRGQPYPGLPQASLAESDIDKPLLIALMDRWLRHYSEAESEWSERALFRSLNMANEAARVPVNTAATFYDFGRPLAIWVSAFEILTHPGSKGKAGLQTVWEALNKVTWINKKLSEARYSTRNKQLPQTLACHIYERVYSLRNDFLHGNEVSPNKLSVGKKPMIDYAACLYRLVLTGVLGLVYAKPMPSLDRPKQFAHYIADCMTFNSAQEIYERALETFL